MEIIWPPIFLKMTLLCYWRPCFRYMPPPPLPFGPIVLHLAGAPVLVPQYLHIWHLACSRAREWEHRSRPNGVKGAHLQTFTFGAV